MKIFHTLFTFVVAVAYVAGDVPLRYRALPPNDHCIPPDSAAQMVMHCLDKIEGNCCESVVASLGTSYLEGQDLVPCFCSVAEELLQYSAFISTEDVINLYFACGGLRVRTDIEQTVASCTGEVLAPSPSPPTPN